MSDKPEFSNALDERYVRIPVSEITATPDGLVMAHKDYWWSVTPNNEVLRYGRASLQCNPHREVIERLLPDGCTAVQLPIAFIKVHPHDFA